MDEGDKVGITVRYKYDQKPFRQSTRGASERKCQFADDGRDGSISV